MEALVNEYTDYFDLGYIVYSSVTREPVAVFKSKSIADYLAFMIDSDLPVEKATYPLEEIQIDEHLNDIRAGKMPFNVNMLTDGSVLFDIEDANPQYISKPGIAQLPNELPQGIFGTFWAEDYSTAQNLANGFRLQMMEEGKL